MNHKKKGLSILQNICSVTNIEEQNITRAHANVKQTEKEEHVLTHEERISCKLSSMKVSWLHEDENINFN
jgi:hypothetical protein